MKRKHYTDFISNGVNKLEILLSVLIIVGVAVSIPDLLKYFMSILESPKGESYILVRDFLSHVLLLVIGLELVMMMIAHSDASIIYLMVMVIARKMLILGNTSVDLLVGTAALVLLFFIRKYLLPTKSNTDPSVGIFSAATTVDEINRRLNYDIDDMGFETVGGLVHHLTKEQGQDIDTGTSLFYREYLFEIEDVNEGIINTISIERIG